MKFDTKPLFEGFKNMLVEAGLIKSDDSKLDDVVNKLVGAVENTLKPIADLNVEDVVRNQVAELMKATGEGSLVEMIQNALSTELKRTGEGSVAQALENAVTTQVTNKTKDLATKEEVKKLENDVAGKLGGPSSAKNEKQEDRKITNKNSFYQVGEFVSE